MPPNRRLTDNQRTPMPSRATSAFVATVRSALHERACDYVMWVAGHGGDTATVQRYNQACAQFPSHFAEWAHSLSRTDLVASIPVLRTLMPGLVPAYHYTKYGVQIAESVPATPHPLPEIVAVVVTLATQQHILRKAQDQRSAGTFGGNLSSHDPVEALHTFGHLTGWGSGG